MEVVHTRADIEANLRQLETHLTSADPEDREFARSLIRLGRCFVATHRDDGRLFGPSRFVGYRDNSRAAHAANDDKDGKETNRAISSILGKTRAEDAELREEYRAFCQRVGVECRDLTGTSIQRWYWPLD